MTSFKVGKSKWAYFWHFNDDGSSYLERLKQDDSILTLLSLSSVQTKIEYAFISV